jgi:hypothetical protein
VIEVNSFKWNQLSRSPSSLHLRMITDPKILRNVEGKPKKENKK